MFHGPHTARQFSSNEDEAKKSKTNRRGSDKQEQRYMKEREIEKHAGDPRGLLVFFSEGRLKGAELSQRAEGPSIAAVSFRLHFLTFAAGKRPSMADQKEAGRRGVRRCLTIIAN